MAKGTWERESRLQILVHDPDEGTRLLIKEVLGAYPTRIEWVEETDVLVDALQQHQPQLVLLALPDLAERAASRLADVRSYDRDVSLIALAEDPTVDTAVLAMKHRALEYLIKPIGADALRGAIDAAIREKGLLVNLEQRLNREIGHRLRERRGALGLTLRQLANRTGLSISLVSQIELGKSAASIASLYKLSRALRVRMSELLERI